MRRASRRARPLEAGGTLVGHYTDDMALAVVERALLSMGNSSRWSFIRPSDLVDRALDRAYRRSQGRVLYLGEWHSHPGGSVEPSARDRESLLELAANPKVAAFTPLLLILGGDLRGPPGLWVAFEGDLVAGVLCAQ